MTDYPKRINGQGVEVVDTSDGPWATYLAEGRDQLAGAKAALAEARHQLDLAKAEGLHALNTVQFDPEIAAQAQAIHNENPSGPSPAELVEKLIIPIRQAFLVDFESSTAPVARKDGPNLAAFNALIKEGGSNG